MSLKKQIENLLDKIYKYTFIKLENKDDLNVVKKTLLENKYTTSDFEKLKNNFILIKNEKINKICSYVTIGTYYCNKGVFIFNNNVRKIIHNKINISKKILLNSFGSLRTINKLFDEDILHINKQYFLVIPYFIQLLFQQIYIEHVDNITDLNIYKLTYIFCKLPDTINIDIQYNKLAKPYKKAILKVDT